MSVIGIYRQQPTLCQFKWQARYPLGLPFATIAVMSSCCLSGLNRRTSSKIAVSNPSQGSSRYFRSVSVRHCSPNSSPLPLHASVMPSVYSASTSPGASSCSLIEQSHSLNSPSSVPVDSSRSTPPFLLTNSPDKCPQLA